MKKKKQSKLKRLIEIQSIVTGVAVFLFFVFSLISARIDSGDFVSSKHQTGSIKSIFSQNAENAPTEPTVSLSCSCEPTGSKVTIDWDDDENAASYDIFRNGSTLVTGLVDSNYLDNNVDDSTTYLYYVTANGLAGNEASEIESVTTPDCSNQAQTEDIAIVTFNDSNVRDLDLELDTTERKPEITGTTTIDNALVDIQLQGASTNFALTNANNAGYWKWTPVSNLDFGNYTMYVTATDQLNNSKTANLVFSFEIEREDEEEDDAEVGVIEGQQSATHVNRELLAEKPMDFSIVVTNEYGKVSSGGYLELRLIILNVEREYEDKKGQMNVSIVGVRGGEELARDSFDLKLYGGQRLEKKIKIPCPQSEGGYIIRTEILVDDQRVSEETVVDVEKGEECINAGAGLKTRLIGGELQSICAFTDWLGWLVIILILILLILILILMVLNRKNNKKDPKKIIKKRKKKDASEQ